MKNQFDTTKYIKIPYKNKGREMDGCDCWGLIRLVYSNEFNIDLPSFSAEYSNASEGKIVAKAIKEKRDIVNYIQKETPEYGDLIIFNIRGNPCHVGIFVGRNKVLHVLKGANVVIESLDSYRLKGRTEGYYEING